MEQSPIRPEAVHALPARKPTEDESADMGLMLSPMIAMMSLWTKNRLMAWFALLSCLYALGSRKTATFQWSTFFSSLMMCVFVIVFSISNELNPPADKKA